LPEIKNDYRENTDDVMIVCFHIVECQAVECANALMDKVATQNRRTLDLLAAKCYYYYSRSYEVTEQLDRVRRYCF